RRASARRPLPKGEAMRITLRLFWERGRGEQLYRMSSSFLERLMIRRPRLAGFQDGVDDREQLVHARNQSDLHRLTVGEQALVERHQSRVMPHRSQRRHVQGGAHRRATAPCDSLPAVAATIAIERRPPNQLADLRTAQT